MTEQSDGVTDVRIQAARVIAGFRKGAIEDGLERDKVAQTSRGNL
jgi:hypothetical protein